MCACEVAVHPLYLLSLDRILVATDLVARGMDFVSVNTVVNFDFPQSTTQYVHRVGRAGRAGRTGALREGRRGEKIAPQSQ